MARIYPAELLSTSPNSEIKVRECLSTLDDAIILHSVVWQSRRNNKQSDGEADFIVVMPTFGILILEVKGGGIEVINGSWYSTGSNGIKNPIKNPFDQAKDSKYALLAYFKDIDPNLTRIPIVHGVVFPNIVVDKALGTNAPRPIIIDRFDLDKPLATIKRIFDHWEKSYSISNDEIERIVSHLAPTLKVRRLLSDEIGDAEKALITLTSEQMRVLQLLQRVKKAAILGRAGTGKTILAVEKARQLVVSGSKTLLLCYNGPLRKHISTALQGTQVDVESFHGLTIREARFAKLKIPFNPNHSWFETEAPKALYNTAMSNGMRYDAILIDEAQDFAQEWLGVIQQFLSEDGLLYLFADSHQNLYRRGWSIPEDLAQFELTVNCRNTKQIAQRVANIFGDVLDDKLVEGPDPKFIEVVRREHIAVYVAKLVENLILEEKMSLSQLIVLTDTAALANELRTTGAAGFLFTTLDGYGIPTETIFRFKGLERDVVVLALSDNMLMDDIQTLAYVGLSRAKAGLYVVASRKFRDTISWK